MNPLHETLPHCSVSGASKRNSHWESYIKGGYYHTPPIPATTQKARGIFFIMNKSSVIEAVFSWRVPKHILFNAGQKFSSSSFNYPVFVRPCPTVPRHGFVDSTVCNNAEELNAVSQETFEEEENAEVLVTKPVNAAYGAILTDGVLTFANGNDGATSGNNVKYFYLNEDPIAPAINLDPNIMLEGEVPFYEFVIDKSRKVNLVQVRSAPGVPKCKDYIPEEVTVEKIIKAEGDLLEWEKLLATVDPRTTIVDHTNGSLASHYAIHAIINKIPIFTSYLPSVGDVVPATVENADITEDDREKFYQAFCYGFSGATYAMKNSKLFNKSNSSNFMTNSLRLSLAVLHNFSAISMAKDYEVVGITLGLFLRATFAVSAGETRYGKNKINSSSRADFRDWKNNIPSDRDGAYKWMYKKSAADVIDCAQTIFDIFDKISWGGGYGGKKWASCTRSTIDLFNACVKRDITSVVQLFNQVLHEEHNGGRYLNKVINIGEFDHAAENPSMFSLRRLDLIIDMLSQIWEYRGVTPHEEIAWDKFVPIDIHKKSMGKATKHNPVGRWKIHGAKAWVDINGNVTKLYVESSSFATGPALNLKIKGPKVDIGKYASGWHEVSSVPYYWKLGNTKVASKTSVNTMIDKVEAASGGASAKKKFVKKASVTNKFLKNTTSASPAPPITTTILNNKSSSQAEAAEVLEKFKELFAAAKAAKKVSPFVSAIAEEDNDND